MYDVQHLLWEKAKQMLWSRSGSLNLENFVLDSVLEFHCLTLTTHRI